MLILESIGAVALAVALVAALVTGQVLNIGELVGPMFLPRRADAFGYWWRVGVIAAGLTFLIATIIRAL